MHGQWYNLIFEMIDFRSFSNLWYWIALAVLWSAASHRVLGVPYDMISRARRQGGQAQQDLEVMVRLNVERALYITNTAGLWIAGFAFFLLSCLAVLGFVYRLEFAQAVFLLTAPLVIVGLVTLHTARRIDAGNETGDALHRRLILHRMAIQALGMLSILVTSLYGMYVNLQLGALG